MTLFGSHRVLDDRPFKPLKPGREAQIIIEASTELCEPNAAPSSPLTGYVWGDHQFANRPLLTGWHVEDRIKIYRKQHPADSA